MTTTIDVVLPAGWRLETETEKEDVSKIIKNKSNTNSAQFSWLNKNNESFKV